MSELGIFILFPALWYLGAWLIVKNSPWPKLVKIYGTERTASFEETKVSSSNSCQIVINGSRFRGSHVIPYDEGVLYCGNWIGVMLRLQTGFLIPWTDFKSIIRKKVPFLNVPYYAAIVETPEGIFEISVPNKTMKKGISLGFFPEFRNDDFNAYLL